MLTSASSSFRRWASYQCRCRLAILASWFLASLSLAKSAGLEANDFQNINCEAPVPFPYPGNLPVTVNIVLDGENVAFTWNGITAQLPAGQQSGPQTTELLSRLLAQINAPAELLRKHGSSKEGVFEARLSNSASHRRSDYKGRSRNFSFDQQVLGIQGQPLS
jgi:hypothetical protein